MSDDKERETNERQPDTSFLPRGFMRVFYNLNALPKMSSSNILMVRLPSGITASKEVMTQHALDILNSISSPSALLASYITNWGEDPLSFGSFPFFEVGFPVYNETSVFTRPMMENRLWYEREGGTRERE